MNCQLGPVIVADLIGRNFEMKRKPIALHFDVKLEKFNEFSTRCNICNSFDLKEFEVKRKPIALHFDVELEKFNEVSFCHKNWRIFDGVEF